MLGTASNSSGVSPEDGARREQVPFVRVYPSAHGTRSLAPRIPLLSEPLAASQYSVEWQVLLCGAIRHRVNDAAPLDEIAVAVLGRRQAGGGELVERNGRHQAARLVEQLQIRRGKSAGRIEQFA